MNTTLYSLAQKTLKLVEDTFKDIEMEISDLTLGLFYSGLKTKANVMGIGYTLLDEPISKKKLVISLKNDLLSQKTLKELAHFSEVDLGIFRTIKLIAINALSQSILDLSNAGRKDILEYCDFQKDEKVGMVGNIHPISKTLREIVDEIYILDKFDPPKSETHVYSLEKLSDLPKVDHLFISGSALVFDDFDEILTQLKGISGERVLVGPSAQILPEIAFELGFSLIGSSRVIYPDHITHVIKQGGTYKNFKKFTQKYTFMN